jgi:DNA replicative helicase MCM subunit Mcm2 (Cdc46/Mcm family)
MITPDYYHILDYWFYEVGVNVVPADTRDRVDFRNKWTDYQTEPMKPQDYEQMKKDGDYVKGAAVVTGKVHRGPNVGYYLTGIDFDNAIAVNEFLEACRAPGTDKIPTCEELAKYMLLEHHLDSPDKLHVYAYSKHPLKNKGSDRGKVWFDEKKMPAIEVKGTDLLMFCTPSMNKGGHRYEFLNKRLPPVTEQLENVIDSILAKYKIDYLTKRDRNTREMLDKLDQKNIVGEGSRHNKLLTKMNAMLHDLIRIKPVEEIKQKCIEFNNLYCNPPLPIDEFERMWNDCYIHVVEIESDKDANVVNKSGEEEDTVAIEGLLSVEAAKRLNTGMYAVKGMIIQVSSVIQMVISTDFECVKCSDTKTVRHKPPLFSLPSDYDVGDLPPSVCDKCGEKRGYEVKKHVEFPAMKIQLQDEQKQNALEGLDVVLFGKDTVNVRTGENCMVFGELHVIQQSKNARVTYLFGNIKGGSIEYEKPEAKDIEISAEDLDKLNEFVQEYNMKEQLVSIFAPTIIGHENKKLAIILMYIGAPETEYFRGRIHGLFVGPPGTAKTKLALEAKKLGYPNSRFSSTQGASAKSITAIIDKENDSSYVIRLGVLPQAKGSMCVLNEVASLLMEDQKYLFDVMEEGKFTIDKFGFHREIDTPTTVLGTTNPETAEWHNNVVEKNQIPLRKELVDRYDFVLVFQAFSNQKQKANYLSKKLEIIKQLRLGELTVDYTFLQKLIQRAKSFDPELSDEAKAMIIDYWSKLDSRIFPTNRVAETIIRTSIAFARLHFSNIVTVDIAKEAIDFITELFKEFDKTVVVVQDPRDIACEEIIKYLKETPGVTHYFEECLRHTAHSNTLVETYIGSSSVDNNSFQYRDIANRFKQGIISVNGGKIYREGIHPLKLVFREEETAAAVTTTEEKKEKDPSSK